MSAKKSLQYWEVWYPKAAATGVHMARGLMDPTDVLIFHSAPDVMTVEVSDSEGNRLAFGQDLERTQQSPMCRLTRKGDKIAREDIWPTEKDAGTPVMVPGGEVGILQDWWNADDGRSGAGAWSTTTRCRTEEEQRC